MNLGITESPRIVLINDRLELDIYKSMIDLLQECTTAFSWTYEEMQGLDPKLVEHYLVFCSDAKLVKQKLRRLNPKASLQIKEEIDKSHTKKIIRVVVYL